MTRRASQQSTYTKGELDPDLSDRTDLEHYYNSLAKATNCIFHPQGGFSDRGGFELCSDAAVLASGVQRRLRRRIAPIHITADNLTAINGGVTSNLVDQDNATALVTNAVNTDEFLILDIDLGQPTQVDFIDLIGFSSEIKGADECLRFDYWDGAAWVTWSDAFGLPAAKHIRTATRTRRFGTTPGGPAGMPIVARNWRLVAHGGNGIGQITIKGLRFWRETVGLSPLHTVEVARDKATTYQLAITERNVDVFERQRYVASVPLPVAAQQIDELTFAGGFDTLLVFNELVETPRVTRQGSSSEWNVDAAPYTNVPALVEQVIFASDQDEIQQLSLEGLVAGQEFTVFLGDLKTAPITYVPASLVADVRAALDALPGVAGAAADLIVTQVDAAPTLKVRFSGANGNRTWPLLSAIVHDAAVPSLTTVLQAGLKASGKFMEADTGWPRTGTIVQQRLIVAGFRSAPTSGLASTNPALFNFDGTGSPLTADKAFRFSLDVQEVEIITEIFVGAHLQIFTEAGEWWFEARVLSATQPANFVRASSNGLARGVPLVFADGATLFTQQGGKTLRDFLFTNEEKYQAEPLSVLSPQILTDVVDVAHRPARSVTDGNLIVLVNRDGSAGVVTLLRKQNVIAGAPWTTEGAFRSVITAIDHELYAVIERAGDYWLERWTPDRPLDWATRSIGAPRTVIEGADYLDGRDDVWVIADDEMIGPVLVTGGVIELEEPAADVTFGLAPPWFVRAQPVREKLANSQPFRGPARIYEMELSLKATGAVSLGTNGQPHREVSLTRFDDQFDLGGPLQTEDGGAPQLPMFQRLYTGNIVLTGLLGFAEAPYWELSRDSPAPVHVKMARYELAHRGDQFASGG